jgi:hypothetical protein
MRRVAAALAALLIAAALPLRAQVTRIDRSVPVDRARQDSLRAANDTTRRDTTSRGGIPKLPTRQFPAPDSVLEALKARRGFSMTRYSADSVQLLAGEKEIRLAGQGLIERDGSTLEADTIRYTETNCGVVASGSPRLFDPTGVMIGEGMRYDACNHAGIVTGARTDLVHGGGTWYLQGDMAVDNEEDRVYAAHANITSCDLTDPHYHFATREVKWVNKRLMVSRPAVLYVADVPIIWLPFVFQDTRRGRRSGILAPQFGINDIVRFSHSYNRHISNLGYYWALSDQTDAQVSMDWYASTFWTMNGRFRYRILDRFMAGGLSYQELHETGGTRSRRIALSHSQDFSLTTHLTAYLDYATSSRIISRNAVDPILAIGTIDSRLNYQRRFAGGNLNLGGSRTQSLDKPQVTATFPTIAFTPSPIALSRVITWSPSFSFTNSLQKHAGNPSAILLGNGLVDSLRSNSRQSNISISTPLRVGQWSFSNAVSASDEWSNARSTFTDTTTGAITTQGESFQSGVDWTTGVGLPVLFQGRWNLQPSVNMVNTASGPFLVRNSYTHGAFVGQSKRFQFAVGLSPTIFGLFPGFGPVARIRHAFSPQLAWSYAPAADIPLDYALAINRGNVPSRLTQPARQTLSFGLSQNFEAKLKPPRTPATSAVAAADTLNAGESVEQAPEGRKIKLLSIQSGAISYDFEQAKVPGRTGWATQAWTNTVSSDLVHGLSLSFTQDLWNGPVGYSGSKFAPSLTSVTTGFSISGSTLSLFRRLLGFAPGNVTPVRDSVRAAPSPTDAGGNFTNAFQRGPLATRYSTADRLTPARGGGAFQANLNYSLQRQAAITTGPNPTPAKTTNSMLSGTVQFSPTPHWTVSWQTSYNFTQGGFADHVVRLDRDMHDWRATFTFVKSPNGNFLFNFNIALIAEPDLKFGYDQRNVQ